MRAHVIGMAVLGDMGTGSAPSVTDYPASGEYGPLSPEQLSKLPRDLTPTEKAAVAEWRGGALPPAQSRSPMPQKREPGFFDQFAWWQLALGGLGLGAIGLGLYKAVR
jgi:hypothetical protein